MPHFYDLTFRDWSNEPTTSQVNIAPITVGTIVAVLAEITAYRTAVEGIVIGETASDKIVMDSTTYSAAAADSPLAQRENKWLVRYHGVDNNKKWQVEIGTADLAADGRLIPNSDFADLTEAGMAAFKTAFEALVRPPDSDTSLVVIDSVQFVGRNI